MAAGTRRRRAGCARGAVPVRALSRDRPALRVAGVTEPTRQDGSHALRHLYASVLPDVGESVKALSEYLGYADPGFTLRTCTHLMPTRAERTRRAVNAVLRLGCDPGHDDGPATPPEGEEAGPASSDGVSTA